MSPDFDYASVSRSPHDLAHALESLRAEMRRRYEELAPLFDRVNPSHRQSAANLVDYLTLRQYDLRDLQESLAELGLSSLGRAEEHVITTLERVLDNLHLMEGSLERPRTEAAVDFREGRQILESNARSLLGPLRHERTVRILVTMPREAATNYPLVVELMEQGMDCARINCAHDEPDVWRQMAENIRRASLERDRPCPILMDLSGPKLRTGPIEPGPRVVRLHPSRDALGRSIAPALARLVDEDERFDGGDAPEQVRLPVPREWLERLCVGDTIHVHDTRDSSRRLKVTQRDDEGCVIETSDTTYLATGTRLIAPDHQAATIGMIPALPQFLTLRVGDVITLTKDLTPVAPGDLRSDALARTGESKGTPRRQRIGCTLAEVFTALRVGHRVFFDDGKIGGEVFAVRVDEADIRITAAARDGSKLRAEKGINVPDTDLNLPALGPDDIATLDHVVRHADLVGLSFAQGASDVQLLQDELDRLHGDLGIVLKVETVQGFEALPEMLLAAMASPRVGVMLARGDLAVECGFERLAEVQEEILWLCDAAHVPIIWATQVLDNMAKTGQPSRAEIPDAALAGRAECVMMNKGPYIAEAVAALDDIIRRMSQHQHKKTNLMRRLSSWTFAVEQ